MDCNWRYWPVWLRLKTATCAVWTGDALHWHLMLFEGEKNAGNYERDNLVRNSIMNQLRIPPKAWNWFHDRCCEDVDIVRMLATHPFIRVVNMEGTTRFTCCFCRKRHLYSTFDVAAHLQHRFHLDRVDKTVGVLQRRWLSRYYAPDGPGGIQAIARAKALWGRLTLPAATPNDSHSDSPTRTHDASEEEPSAKRVRLGL